MTTPDLQSLCQLGQSLLTDTDYLAAERTLIQAESLALASSDFDTLARLYMPLQEARRQRRQRAGEGTIVLDLFAQSPTDNLDPLHILQNFPHGQLLVAGYASLQPSLSVRELADHHNLYLDTYLASVFPTTDAGLTVAILPTPDSPLPTPDPRPTASLRTLLPPYSLLIPASSLPAGSQKGSPSTFAQTMSLWEQLHTPFLQLADNTPDPLARIHAYRHTLRIDYACELAHQRLSQTAHRLAQSLRK